MKALFPIYALTMMSPLLCAQSKAMASPTPGGAVSDWIVRGRVTELVTGRGIATATVIAIDSHRKVYTTLTNPDGSYRLEHIPHERSVTVRCSQLGYSPNPRGAVATFKDGISTWNPRLVPENADTAYLDAAASYVATLPPGASMGDAIDLAVNLPGKSRSVVAADLQSKWQDAPMGVDHKNTLALFIPGPASDEAISKAIQAQLDVALSPDRVESRPRTQSVKVQVTDGHATVSGQVLTAEDKSLVHERVRGVPSVASIDDKMTIQNPNMERKAAPPRAAK